MWEAYSSLEVKWKCRTGELILNVYVNIVLGFFLSLLSDS